MDIKVGEYIRTKGGYIVKTTKKTNIFNLGCKEEYIDMETTIYGLPYGEEIAKHSKNIIDLIEVGDIVNNGYIYEVGKTKDGHKWVHNLNGLLLFENDIKTILTHEQYNASCYKVKGE